jgi:hypothetical protein
MKLITALNVLEAECKFLGVYMDELLWDVERQGRMVYSERVVEAYQVFVAKKPQISEDLSPFSTVNS